MSTRCVILCGACVAERRKEPGVLGEVVELPGRLLWHGYDPASARRLRNFRDDGISEPPLARHAWMDLEASSDVSLSVWCRWHGRGVVGSTSVVACRGSMAIEFAATR
jgi:hypothetical protein